MARHVELVFRASTVQARAELAALAEEARAANVSVRQSTASTSRALMTVGRGAQSLGRGMVAAAVPLVALGYFSSKAAMNFQTAMLQIRTQAGASQKDVNKLSKEVLALASSGKVIQGPTDLANGLYHLMSVMHNAPQAFQALKVAAQGAAVGNTDLESTSSALAGVWTQNMRGAGSFQQIMGVLNATVGAGNMRMADLIQALGTGFLSAFKNAGLTIQDAGAALALFTDAGYKGSSAAAQASTALHYMIAPTARAQKAMMAMGMTGTQMAEDMHKPNGMLVAFQDLRKHLSAVQGGLMGVPAEQLLAAILPGGRGRILQTFLNDLNRYLPKLQQVYGTTSQFGASVKATMELPAMKLKAAWSQVQASMTEFGATLLPIVGSILPKLAAALKTIFGFFKSLPGPVKTFLGWMTVFLVIGGGTLLLFGKFLVMLGKMKEAWAILKGLRIIEWLSGIGGAGGAAAAGVASVGTAATGNVAKVNKIKGAIAAMNAEMDATAAAGAAAGGGEAAAAGGAVAGMSAAAVLGVGAAATLPFLGLALATKGSNPGKNYTHLRIGNQTHRVAVNPATLRFGTPTTLPNDRYHGASGGLVTPGGIRRYQYGGVAGPGTDSVLGWLTPGEGILNTAAMSGIGASGLAQLNSGQAATGPMEITPSPVYLMIDGRQIGRALIQYTLRSAARGPATLSGGSLMTGAAQLAAR